MLAPPAAPAAPTFAAVGCTTQTVNWAAVTGATAYDVYRTVGPSCAGAVKINAAPVSGTTYPDTGLTELTQYSYHILASNTCGTSPNGVCASSTTITLPAVPTEVVATPSCTANVISWTPSAGATAYDVKRGTTCGTAVNTWPNVTSPYNDTTATAGTTYNYWVIAKNACGNSANSACATTARLKVPGAPTAVTATPSCSDISISWTGNAESQSYNVLRGTACGTALTSFPGVTSPYSDATAAAGTTYRYWVVGVNGCGNSANSTCATTTLLITPAAPTAPTFTLVGCTTQTLSWTAVTGARPMMYGEHREQPAPPPSRSMLRQLRRPPTPTPG